MEDDEQWWAKFKVCEQSCSTLIDETISEGMPQRADALDWLLEQLREKLLEGSQAELRAWKQLSVRNFHPRLRPIAAFAETKLSRLAAALEWKAAELRLRLKAGLGDDRS